jgi:deoxyribonuclease-4
MALADGVRASEIDPFSDEDSRGEAMDSARVRKQTSRQSSFVDSSDGLPKSQFGAHMSIAGGHFRAADAAAAAGCEAFQVFTKSTNQWQAKPLTTADVEAFHAAIERTRLPRPVAHNSYLINLASPDEALWEKSIASLVCEVERAELLGITDLVMHPGAHVGSGEQAGLRRIAEGLLKVMDATSATSVVLDLEVTAGQGSCLGHRLEHLAELVDRTAGSERIGVCLDTCHLFAAGYVFGTEAEYNALIAELERTVGLGRIRVWHLNDSVKGPGSRVDRHAGIGRGAMGEAPFGHVVRDARFAGLPMILETPKGRDEDGEDLDAKNLAVLRRLRGTVA